MGFEGIHVLPFAQAHCMAICFQCNKMLWTNRAMLQEGINMYRRRVYAGLGFIAISWVAVILTLFLSCRPLYKMWQIYPDPGGTFRCSTLQTHPRCALQKLT